jgi:glucose-1-phosphate thymidylyltransferase
VIRNSIIAESAQVLKALLENSIVGPGAVVRGNYRRINVGDSSEVEYS